MNVLILGSEGFIGGHTIGNLYSLGYNTVGCDLLNNPSDKTYKYIKFHLQELEILFKSQYFDFCLNCAGSGSVPLSVSDPLADFEANVSEPFKILDLIRRYSPHCKYINLSSAAVYGNPQTLPVAENSITVPLSPYGWHKLFSEKICLEFSSIYKVKTCSVRPFSVYGPGLRKQLFWDLYKKVAENPPNLELFGTGNESRDFIYIDDLAKALHIVMQNADFQGEAINIGSGTETTISQVASLFTQKYNYQKPIIFNNKVRVGDPLNWKADISKLKKYGFTPKFTIDEGLEIFVAWLKEKGSE